MQCIVWSMAHAELPGRPNHCSLDLHWGGTWGVGWFFLSSGFHGGFSIFWDFGGIHTPQKLPSFIELDDGKIYRKTLYLMVKTMVSCRFSLKPILWIIFPIILWSSDPYSILTGSYELRATNWGKPVSMVKMFGYRKFQWDSHHYGKKNHQNGDLEGVYHIYDICVSYGIVGF